MRAPADGHTLLLVPPDSAINVALYDKLNFNFLRDIAPVASIISLPLVMVVNPSVSAKTVPAKRLASLSLDTTRHTCRVSE